MTTQLDRTGILRKTLKKWESAFFETHETKPTRSDIASAPQRIQDAYSEYNKLRKGGDCNGEKNEASQVANSQSDAWGSHLNKSNTADKDKGKETQHSKGSLLSKLSQKLYENFSTPNKTPKRSTKASDSPENELKKDPLSSCKILSENNDLPSAVFGSTPKSQKDIKIKFTNTSVKLQNSKISEGPASSNILLKSQDRKHSWKSDWVNKCKPEIQNKKKTSVNSRPSENRLNCRSEVETTKKENAAQVTDAKLGNMQESGISSPAEECFSSNVQETSCISNEECFSSNVLQTSCIANEECFSSNVLETSSISNEECFSSNVLETSCIANKECFSSNVLETSSISNEHPSLKVGAKTPQKGMHVSDKPAVDMKGDKQGTQNVFRTKTTDSNGDDICKGDEVRSRCKRKRVESESSSAKRVKESEDSFKCDPQPTTQYLSSYEAFDFTPEDNMEVTGESQEIEGDRHEDAKDELVIKKKKIRKSAGSSVRSTSTGGTTQKVNLNQNFVRLNMKYKSYSRGRHPGKLKGSAYKRHMWKQREKGGSQGRGGGGRGGGGRGRGGKPWLMNRTEDTCFKCGGKGHWASQCNGQNTTEAPQKVVEEDLAMKLAGESEEFPTLEEAALAAAGIRLGEDLDEKGLTVPSIIPLAYEDPTPPPPIEPLFAVDDVGMVIDTPQSVKDALNDMGFSSFRPGQEHTIMRILSGLSTLVVLSTGAGKSLTYQLPAYIYAQRTPCITLVISPLVSLMDDQIFGLPKCLKGARLHSNMSKVQREKVVTEIIAGNVNVLLISPEAIVGGGNSGGGCLPPINKLPPIAFACIDEAHCVSEWSHNFRPSYLMLCRVLRERMGVQCLLGLTATATLATANSVAEHFQIAGDPDAVIRGSSVPNNLMLSASRDPNRERALVELLNGERFLELDSIIIYCIRRQETEKVASLLRTCIREDQSRVTPAMVVTAQDVVDTEGVKKKKGKKTKASSKKAKTGPVGRPPANSAESYHAGMSPAQRRKVQNHFMAGKLRIVVATVAFGMGLDKSDVRAVIHYNLPKSFESYVQEIGRAGRDGQPSHCHVFLDPEGSDLCELRRHTYANSVGRVTVKKLVKKVFLPCKCTQLHNLNTKDTEIETKSDDEALSTPRIEEFQQEESHHEESHHEAVSGEKTTGGEIVSTTTKHASQRLCPGHQVAFPIEATVQELDLKEESIATLLCYLELHKKRWIRNLSPLYATCNVICYGGPTELRAMAKKCPPVAVAIARDQMNGKSHRHSTSVEFNVVEVASSMGWDVVPVKRELRQLQWKQVPGKGYVKSGTLVEFSEVAFSLRAPGDMKNDEMDEVVGFLADRTEDQEKRELYQLQSVYSALHSISCKHYAHCCDSIDEDSSNRLKELLRQYFQSENTSYSREGVAWEWITPGARQKPEAQAVQVHSDVRQFIGLHEERSFSGRAVARIFHGIASPCYPAQVWGRDRRFWRRHLDFDFSKLVKIATDEILRMR